MKRFSSLLVLTLLAINTFVPFGISLSSNFLPEIVKNTVSADTCTILSAEWSPAGEQSKSTFYRDGKTAANIVVGTKGCVDQPGITLTVFESDSCPQNCDDALIDSNLLRRQIKVPSDNFTIRIRLGEEECEAGLSGSIGYDCDLFFYIRQGDTTLYNSSGKTNGDIYYECDGLCFDNAELLKIYAQGSDSNPTTVDINTSAINEDVYTLLAPIGNINCVSDTGMDKDGNQNCIVGNGIGYYLNAIFLLAIGLCGALAVIMIIISGIQYMGDESVFGKTEAKSKIFAAILGLLIALGSYALLRTINPDLTGSDGVSISQVEAEIDDQPILSDENTVAPIGTNIAKCPEGVEPTQTATVKFITCKSISVKFKQMISDALAAGMKITGGGFRTRAEQVALYQKNCGGGTRKCNPPTAKPGSSMHESGLAFDLKCDGNLINFDGNQRKFPIVTSTKKCFDWLAANAYKYGLQNFKRENWHWSTNGH